MDDGRPFLFLSVRRKRQIEARLSHPLLFLERRNDLCGGRRESSAPGAGCGRLDEVGEGRRAKCGSGSVRALSVRGGGPENGVRMHHRFSLADGLWTSLCQNLRHNTGDVLGHTWARTDATLFEAFS